MVTCARAHMSRSHQVKTQEQTTVGHHFLMTLFYTLVG